MVCACDLDDSIICVQSSPNDQAMPALCLLPHCSVHVMQSQGLTIFQIVELQSPSLSAHLTIGVNGGSSIGSTLSHDGDDTSVILSGLDIST